MLNTLSANENNSEREDSSEREEIDQVRNLLFGELQRENQKRFAEIDKRIDELRMGLERKLSMMAEDNTASKAQLVRAMGDAMSELGRQITMLADSSTGDTADHE